MKLFRLTHIWSRAAPSLTVVHTELIRLQVNASAGELHHMIHGFTGEWWPAGVEISHPVAAVWVSTHEPLVWGTKKQHYLTNTNMTQRQVWCWCDGAGLTAVRFGQFCVVFVSSWLILTQQRVNHHLHVSFTSCVQLTETFRRNKRHVPSLKPL